MSGDITNTLEYVASPMANLVSSEHLDITPEWRAELLGFVNNGHQVGLMRKAVVELDGKKILTDLAFFTKVRKNDDLVGATATCKVTSTKAQSKAGAIYIVLPSGHIRF